MLKESPFAAAYSPELYWESRKNRALAAQALEILQSGGSVWIKGARASGRQSFLRHLAGKAAARKLPVAIFDNPPPSDGEAFIESLLRRVSDQPVPSTHIEKCEHLYAALLEGLWRGGAVLALTTPDPLSGDALGEAGILCGLKVLEQPLSSLLCCGEKSAPLTAMKTLELASYTEEELGRILNHRLVMSGNANAMEPSQVAEIAAGAKGPSELMERGDIALGRLLYKKSADTASEQAAPAAGASGNSAQKAPRDIFSPEDVALVSKLLDEI